MNQWHPKYKLALKFVKFTYPGYENQGRANSAVENGFSDGRCKRPNYDRFRCPICKQSYHASYHHPNYNKPFEILWWCTCCHLKYHANWRREHAMALAKRHSMKKLESLAFKYLGKVPVQL